MNGYRQGSRADMYIGFAYSLIALLVFLTLIVSRSSADDVSTTVTISNLAPSLGAITVAGVSYGGTLASSGITLTEGATTTIYIYGNATDAGGCQEIDSASQFSGKFYRTDVNNGVNCSLDNNNCYSLGTAVIDQCSAVDGTGTVERYQFSKAIAYYADPTTSGSPHEATTWTANVTVTNNSSLSASTSVTVEMNTLLALNVASSISYGSVPLGGTSSEQTVVLTNTGNIVMNALVSGASMVCSMGTVPASFQHWSLTPSFSYSSGIALSGTAVNMHNFTPQRTNDASSSSTNTYWKFKAPSTGVLGVCTGTGKSIFVAT